MSLPSSGAISFSQINTELGRSSTAQISLGCSTVRTLFGQASGSVDMNTGHGKAASGSVTFTTPGCYSWTVPSGVTSISILAISGGSSGSVAGVCHLGPAYDCCGRLMYNATYYHSGQGGRGGALGWRNNFSVTPGQTLYIKVAYNSRSYGCRYGNYYGDISYVTTCRNNTNYCTYYHSAWQKAIVIPAGPTSKCSYTANLTQNGYNVGPQSPSCVGSLTKGSHPFSLTSQGGNFAATVRGTFAYNYYPGSGVDSSRRTGGGGGGGPNLINQNGSYCYAWSAPAWGSSYGTGGTVSTTGCHSAGIGGANSCYFSSSGQGNTCSGGSGGNAGNPGYGTGALFGSGSSAGGASGYGAGGQGACAPCSGYLSSGDTNNNSGSGAVRIVWPGSSRGWPNNNVNYGC
jgi:hypothetical protein